MTELTFPLLGSINRDAGKDSPLRTKYLLKVTARELATLLQYERAGKKKNDPFRIKPGSTIQIDSQIQRGTDEAGNARQQPSKIFDIARTLTGDVNAAVKRAYLGTLVWNVRPPNSFEIATIQKEGKPSEYRIAISTDAIYLTDSAHRHFGIVEAFALWAAAPDKWPKFRPEMEFSVEVYNLDKVGERELFSELNAKQKKISAAKVKELDVSSPIGTLKDAIVDYDVQSRKLLDNNIEVSANTNKHTLMTMSVFVSSIAEMFTTKEILDAHSEEDPRSELAEYYCEFLYRLSEAIIVKCDMSGSGEEDDVHPFRNLYTEVIKPVVNNFDAASPESSENHIAQAWEKARRQNDRLRGVDIANHNVTVKALFRLGGYIRQMPRWTDVVDRIQTNLVAPMQGKFFQKENKDWFAKSSDRDVPIASLNEDGTINLQVQTKNISKLYSYLLERLDLVFHPVVFARMNGEAQPLVDEGGTLTWTISRHTESFKTFELRFIGIKSIYPDEESVGLSIDGGEWREVTRRGKASLSPTSLQIDASYAHPYYEDLTRWTASFEVKLPIGKHDAKLELTFNYPDIDGTNTKVGRTLNLVLGE